MNQNSSGLITKILASIGCALLGVFGGLVVGATFGGNFAVGFRFLGLRGYEATGIIGAMIGALLGALIGVMIVRYLRQKRKNTSSAAQDLAIGLIVGAVFILLLVIPQQIEHARYAEDYIEPDLTARDAWAEMGAIIERAIYDEDVDAMLALTPPGSVTKEEIQKKLAEWSKYKYQTGGMGGMLDLNDESVAFITIGGIPEQFVLNRIDGRWYLML